ncbi:MAG: hypothetical protein EZS28_021796 [Streblomastix strix]|uniref:Uncharacterized protein n=1 Tax=Streblomastix strix TaxID=222440 RepID=A0A5J4VJ46_9EUKA|nr:MAG: hypothetical protein EZS28_021796 [Streblomastix strix]
MGQPDQVVKKSIDRGRMVDIVNQKQQSQEHRNAQDLSNNNYGCISGEIVSNLISTEIIHSENIQTMENDNPSIEQKRNNSNLIRTELFLANIAIQPFAILQSENGQHNSMLQLNQKQTQSKIEKINGLDPFIHRITTMGSQVQTYPWNQKHGS